MNKATDLKHGRAGGFTRADLTATLAAMGLLALTLSNTLAKPRSASRSSGCLNNLQQMIRAWQIYTSDNSDRLPGVNQGGSAQSPTPNDPLGLWAAGWLDWYTARDNTNILYLTDSRYASLARYLGNRKDVYKCPGDTFLSATQRKLGWTERVRSISADVVVGDGNAESGPFDGYYKHAKKTADLTIPGPSETFVYLDENPDSMNDPGFYPPSSTQYVDQPASYHDGGGGVVFADGHAETHFWKTGEIPATVRFSGANFLARTPGNPDFNWLRSHAPRRAE